jgi:hypothetical protein
MSRTLIRSGVIAVIGASLCGGLMAAKPERVDLKHLSKTQRLSAIRRASVWTPADVGAMDLLKGPDDSNGFSPDETVTCDYVERKLGGATPKFACQLTPGDEVKVKYGWDNGEVFSEVAATRLLWALGFGADHMYPVHVMCRHCPARLAKGGERRPDGVYFEVAAIERKMPGKEMERDHTVGWSWHELGQISETLGGAPRAQVEALELLAVFIQHTDSKTEQQRLSCLSSAEEIQSAGECTKPFMLINDVGATFGAANLFNRAELSDTNLERWRHVELWKDPKRCVANLAASQTGTLNNPEIREPGRRFLADLIGQLSDAQIAQMFEAARVNLRSRNAASGPRSTIDEWVDAFKFKRDEIVHHECPTGA